MNIQEFKSKPHKVKAIQLLSSSLTSNINEVAEWCGGSVKEIKLPLEEQIIHIWNKTLDRELTAQNGDYIYTDDTGEFFVSPEEIFLDIYEYILQQK